MNPSDGQGISINCLVFPSLLIYYNDVDFSFRISAPGTFYIAVTIHFKVKRCYTTLTLYILQHKIHTVNTKKYLIRCRGCLLFGWAVKHVLFNDCYRKLVFAINTLLTRYLFANLGLINSFLVQSKSHLKRLTSKLGGAGVHCKFPCGNRRLDFSVKTHHPD